MGETPTPASPFEIDLDNAGPCLHCSCCRGLVLVPNGKARVCYTCAINHGIPLRQPAQILKEGEGYMDDLRVTGSMIEAVESISTLVDSIRRGEGETAKDEIRGWMVDHVFTTREARDFAQRWNRMVRFLLGNARAGPPPDIEQLCVDLKACFSTIATDMQGYLNEYRLMAGLEASGHIPERLRCPMNNAAAMAGAY